MIKKTLIVSLTVIVGCGAILSNGASVYASGDLGTTCSSHTDCEYGTYCESGTCHWYNCYNDSECGSGLFCELNQLPNGMGGDGSGYCTYSLSNPTPAPVPTPTPTPVVVTPVEPKVEPKSVATDIEYSDSYVFEGSKTTDLSGILEKDAGSVKNFTLDNKELGSLKFNKSIDFNDEGLVKKLNNLEEYLIFEKGSIELKSEDIAELNVPATITFKGINLNDVSQVVILRNGEESNEVSDFEYNSEIGELSFNVTGFSKYQLAPVLEVNEFKAESLNKAFTIFGSVVDLDSTLSISVNGVELEDEVVIAADGSYEVDVELSEGTNEIIVTATSVSGIEEIDTQSLAYIAPSDSWLSLNINYVIIGAAVLIVVVNVVIVAVVVRRRSKKFSK